MKNLLKLLPLVSLWLVSVGDSRGAVIVSYTEVGGNVVFTASGSINTTDLTNSGNSATGSFTHAAAGLLQSSTAGVLWNGPTFDGPSSYGTSPFIGFANASSTGNDFGIREPGSFAGGGVNLPATYVSGTPISGTLTIIGQTIASMGLVPTSTWTWGTGANIDTFTIQQAGIPEPSSMLLIAGAALAGALRRRR